MPTLRRRHHIDIGVAVGVARAIRIIDAVGRVAASVTSIRIGNRVGVIGVGRKFSPVVATAIIEFGCVSGVRIVPAFVAVAAAILAVGIV